MYQKWMKTRPRLNALEMYSTGYDAKKGKPTLICNLNTTIVLCIKKNHIDTIRIQLVNITTD